MTTFADVPLSGLVSLVSAVLVGVIGLITWAVKSIFTYQIERIKALEVREQNLLSGLVDSVENITGSVKVTADFIVALADDRRYQQRKAEENRAEGGGKP